MSILCLFPGGFCDLDDFQLILHVDFDWKFSNLEPGSIVGVDPKLVSMLKMKLISAMMFFMLIILMTLMTLMIY